MKPKPEFTVTVKLEPEKHPINCARYIATLKDRIREEDKKREEDPIWLEHEGIPNDNEPAP